MWTQGSRSVNNDLTCVHEQALLDVAAGMVPARPRFDAVVTLGHSGGGPLSPSTCSRRRRPGHVARTARPGARGLPDADLPLPDGAVFLAPHPGQGALLLA